MISVRLSRLRIDNPFRFVEAAEIDQQAGKVGAQAGIVGPRLQQLCDGPVHLVGAAEAAEQEGAGADGGVARPVLAVDDRQCRSEEHTSELQSLMRISYAVFCLKKKMTQKNVTLTVDLEHP